MKYTFEELINDLEMGHEVEFWFENNKYSLSHNQNGWIFTKIGDGLYQIYTFIRSKVIGFKSFF